MTRTGLVLDDRFKAHDTGPGHPERPQRMDAVRDTLTECGLIEHCERIDADPLDPADIHAVHDPAYVERLRTACREERAHIDCVDSTICADTFDIALLAAGTVREAVDRVARGTLDRAFCAIRPPGHHAERDRSMGFCMFNNIALAVRRLLDAHGVDRVLILDWDVHHGNGTQHIFEADSSVFYCSFHGHPATLYPGTGYADELGTGPGTGTTLNIPFLPGAGDSEYRRAYEERFLPKARDFDPQMILISAGFDAHRDDPLASINLETSSFLWLTRETVRLAEDVCHGRIVSVLEGGYDLRALGESAAVHLQELLET